MQLRDLDGHQGAWYFGVLEVKLVEERYCLSREASFVFLARILQLEAVFVFPSILHAARSLFLPAAPEGKQGQSAEAAYPLGYGLRATHPHRSISQLRSASLRL